MVYTKPEKLLNTQNVNQINLKLSLISLGECVMPKPNIHPQWYPEAKVYCNGEVIMTIGSTKPELNVDMWSGNHPFYTGNQKLVDTEGRVERFLRKYGMLEEADEVQKANQN